MAKKKQSKAVESSTPEPGARDVATQQADWDRLSNEEPETSLTSKKARRAAAREFGDNADPDTAEPDAVESDTTGPDTTEPASRTRSKNRGRRSAAADVVEADGLLTKFEKYEHIEISRDQLKNAPYNPRNISAEARKRLRKNIAKVGMLAPIVWNKVTGNIVGGHQRIAVLDSLHTSRDYRLHVAAVELDEKTEKAQNIFMNNERAQGEFDLDKLAHLFKEDKISFEDSGFDAAEIFDMFGDSPMAEQPEELLNLSNQLRAAAAQYDNVVSKGNVDRDADDYFTVVVFADGNERRQFVETLGFKNSRYLDGRAMWKLLEDFHIVETEAEAATAIEYPLNPCPRCGGDHASEPLPMWPLALAPAGSPNYWGYCPEMYEPVLLLVENPSQYARKDGPESESESVEGKSQAGE